MLRLKRRKVCSACNFGLEKHNVVQAELLPLMDAMQRLPTHAFYARFSDLRSVVNAFKQTWGLHFSIDCSRDDTDDDLDSAAINECDSDDDDLVEHVVPTTPGNHSLDFGSGDGLTTDELASRFVEDPSQISQPDLENAEASQHILDGSAASELSAILHDLHGFNPIKSLNEYLVPRPAPTSGPLEVAQLDGEVINPTEVAQPPGSCESGKSATTHLAGVDVIKLHQPITSRSTSGVTKGRQTRRGLVELCVDCPIDVEELFVWVRHFNDMNHVCEIIERFPALFNEPFLQTRRL
ncbi:unnamed protein product [Phytophthora fragariaefolia]|uniref:Unnamed protein product n=1 Tax=Phytophthora fragariaefolia TaxID=1490495 RepID=A0A9W6Y714_9STRA|nr:unnamed protein product [Phytophthora fragariaefolia]